MQNSGLKKPNFWLSIVIELSLFIVVYCLLFIFFSADQGQLLQKSLFIGFFAFWLPTTFFTLRAFRFIGAKHAKQVTQSLFVAELGKFFLTISCFAISFIALQPLDAKTIFLSYIGFLIVHQFLIAGLVKLN